MKPIPYDVARERLTGMGKLSASEQERRLNAFLNEYREGGEGPVHWRTFMPHASSMHDVCRWLWGDTVRTRDCTLDSRR